MLDLRQRSSRSKPVAVPPRLVISRRAEANERDRTGSRFRVKEHCRHVDTDCVFRRVLLAPIRSTHRSDRSTFSPSARAARDFTLRESLTKVSTVRELYDDTATEEQHV